MFEKELEMLEKEQDHICRSIRFAESKPNRSDEELSNLKEKLKRKTRIIEIVRDYQTLMEERSLNELQNL